MYPRRAVVDAKGGIDASVLKTVLDQYFEILFSDAADDDDHQVDVGLRKLNVGMLAKVW